LPYSLGDDQEVIAEQSNILNERGLEMLPFQHAFRLK
jgi:hypothetical protein